MTTEQIILIGTYTEPIRFGTGRILEGKGEGIYCYRFDPEKGSFRFISLAKGVTNPSFLTATKDLKYVYAVNELKKAEGQDSGLISAFAFDAATGSLTFLNSQLTWGTDPCFVELDRKEKFAAVANFMSGSVAVFPLQPDGSLGKAVCVVQHSGHSVDPARQAGPHAHSIIFDTTNRTMFVPDLGLDSMVAYEFNERSGCLVANSARSAASIPGAGPRHMEIHRSGRFAYTVNELGSTITAQKFDAEAMTLSAFQEISTLPAGYSGASTCADLHIGLSGRFLYASNRGHDSIAIYSIDAGTGHLELLGHESTRGGVPRNFAVDATGRWLLVANQDTDQIVLYRIDQATGMLQFSGTELEIPTPVCVRVFTG